uniref:M24 family metallopeptidase n=1 Tax=Haliangium sp. TaxID=2663208 RepID=UPI003D096B4C
RKAPEELALLRRAADITVEAMTAAMREARPGMGEHELEALVHYVFRRRGGDRLRSEPPRFLSRLSDLVYARLARAGLR